MTNFKGTEFEIHDPANNLTPRQAQVLVWIAEGKENYAIGLLLGITIGTVKFHIIRLLEKFDAPNRQLLISRAFAKGLIRARHLALLLLVGATTVPSTGEQPLVLRTQRIARVRITNRRDAYDHLIVMPTNLDDLRFGGREAA